MIQVSSLRNEGSRRVLLEGLGRISIVRTLVSLIRKVVLPMSWVLQCGRGLMGPMLHLITACWLFHNPQTFFFFFSERVQVEHDGLRRA